MSTHTPPTSPLPTRVSARRNLGFQLACFGVALLCNALPSLAGNKTMVSLAGSGRVEASITWNGATNAAKNPSPLGTASTVNVVKPAAGVFFRQTKPTGFPATGVTADLPTGAPTNVYCRVETKQITGGYKAIVSSYVVAGATADNPDLESKITVTPADCASYNIEADTFLTEGTESGQLLVTGTATAGTAVRFRAFYYQYTPNPNDPYEGPTIEEVLQNGSLKYEHLVAGPFEYGETGPTGCPLLLPFTFAADPKDLYVISDAVAVSTKPTVSEIPDTVFGCDDTLVYPVPQVTGICEDVTVTYSPPATSLPWGGPTPVTVTVTYADGILDSQTFNATRPDPLTISCPPEVIFECGDELVYPAQSSGGCGTVTITYSLEATALPWGVPTQVTATATDAQDNVATCTFTAQRPDPLTIACPPDVVFGCVDTLVYPPVTASGGCGEVSAVFSPAASALPVGVTTVTVTATDGSGNTATCTFKATRQALSFNGFFYPISGTGGSYSAPLRTFFKGCFLPIKFTASCAGSCDIPGTPTLRIISCPNGAIVSSGVFRRFGNEWCFTWDSSRVAKGVYEIQATLQDGTVRNVFIKLK